MPGLPKVMMQKRDKMKADEVNLEQPVQPVVLQHMDTSTLSVEQATPQNEHISSSETAQDDTSSKLSLEDQWRVTSEKWEQKFRSLQGVVENIEPKYKAEQERADRLEREVQALREALPPPPSDTSDDWTEEEVKIYGESRPVIEKAARKIAKGELSAATKMIQDLRKEIEELRERTGRVQQDLTQTSEQQFYTMVQGAVANFDNIINSPSWKSYLSEKPKYSRKTIGELLDEAHNARDLETIQEIFKGFKSTKSALSAMTSPSLHSGAAPINDRPNNQKPFLKWSEWKKISQDANFGRIKRDDPKFIEMKKSFHEAELDGRIDYTN